MARIFVLLVGLVLALGVGARANLDARLRKLCGDVRLDQLLVDGESEQARQQRCHAVRVDGRVAVRDLLDERAAVAASDR